MKKQHMHLMNLSNLSKFIKSGVFALALLTANAASAQSVNEADPAPAAVKYLGNQNDMMVFHVQYENPTGDRFFVTVKDTDGTALYTGAFSEKKFDKKFRVPRTDSNKVLFVIKGSGNEVPQTFEVNSNIRTVEEVVVTKVK
jgi:hypothetical protein